MSEALSSWLRTLVGSAMFCAVALVICPKGRAKRVLNMVCGCVMAIALLSPVVQLDTAAVSRAVGRYRAAAEQVTADAEEAAGLYERRVIEGECETYISDRAASLGVELQEVRVNARWSKEGYWYPWECSIVSPAARSGALSDAIEAELGISPERQNWEVTT